MTVCYHCGEPIPKGINLSVIIDEKPQAMCCHGCQAVAEYLIDHEHTQFYQFRKDQLPTSNVMIDEQFLAFDEVNIFDQLTTAIDEKSHQIRIKIDNMYCNACSWLLNRALSKLRGVSQVNINAINKIVHVSFDSQQIKISEIFNCISHLGYQPSTLKNMVNNSLNERNDMLKKIIVAGFGMMFIMTLAVPLYARDAIIDPAIHRFFLMVSVLVATIVYVYSGMVFLNNAFRDLRNKHFGMDVPIALSISLAYIISVYLSFFGEQEHEVYFDSMTMFIFLILVARFVESQVRHKAMDIRESLFATLPIEATRIDQDQYPDQCIGETIPIDQIKKGDLLLVKSGQTICCDGRIIDGFGTVNEAILTGESDEKSKQRNDQVLAGSQLIKGQIIISATCHCNDSFLSNMASLMELAQSRKPQHQKLIDKVASRFIIAVLCMALGALLWHGFNDRSLMIPAVLSVLIATCPCALSLAAPAALSASGITLQKLGILVNNTDAIMQLADVKQWLFDKTGTLTSSRFSIQNIRIFKNDEDAYAVAAAMQSVSNHPIASAFKSSQEYDFESLEERAGYGIEAILNGQHWRLGSISWLESCGIHIPPIKEKATVIYLSKNAQLIAAFVLHSEIRSGAKQLIDHLNREKKHVSIISGDNHQAVQYCANALNIEKAKSQMSSQQKIEEVMALQSQHQSCVMVGDGVNDGPVLSQADISIGLKHGAPLAHSVSDFIVLGQSMSCLNQAINISKKTQRIIKQNILWSIGYNLSVTPMAVLGLLQPWMAAIGMSVSSLIVVLNARRLL